MSDSATKSPNDHEAAPPADKQSKPAKRLWRWLRYLLILFVLAELFARFGLGLGRPPLMMNDPDVEYCYQPNQDLYRFHNHVKFNAYCMRSDDFPRKKQNPDELRILVLGDSIINGGMRLDQSELATQILQQTLREKLGRPVVVGNVSAGSWGPPNLLAYVNKYGWFDADVVILVLNSEDATDILGHSKPVGTRADMPDRNPPLATWEAHNRYLRRYLPTWLGGYPKPVKKPAPAQASADDNTSGDPEIREVHDAIVQLVGQARDNGARVIAIQHMTRRELKNGPDAGHVLIQKTLSSVQLAPMQLEPTLRESIDADRSPYLDNTHFNELGQRIMADVMTDAVIKSLDTPSN